MERGECVGLLSETMPVGQFEDELCKSPFLTSFAALPSKSILEAKAKQQVECPISEYTSFLYMNF